MHEWWSKVKLLFSCHGCLHIINTLHISTALFSYLDTSPGGVGKNLWKVSDFRLRVVTHPLLVQLIMFF
jgi:hypothetical protein